MKVIHRVRDYYVHDVMVECDCGCSFLRFSVFDNDAEHAYVTYYGEHIVRPKTEFSPLTRQDLKVISEILLGDQSGEYRVGDFKLVRSNDDTGLVVIDGMISKERVAFSLMLSSAQAIELGELFKTW